MGGLSPASLADDPRHHQFASTGCENEFEGRRRPASSLIPPQRRQSGEPGRAGTIPVPGSGEKEMLPEQILRRIRCITEGKCFDVERTEAGQIIIAPDDPD